jgi:hypothetical protein
MESAAFNRINVLAKQITQVSFACVHRSRARASR